MRARLKGERYDAASAAQRVKRMKLIIVRKARWDAATTNTRLRFFMAKSVFAENGDIFPLQDCQQCNIK